MKLSRKTKARMAELSPVRRIKAIPCPNCGTLNADLTRWDGFYLDGTPYGDMQRYLKRYPICKKCGCLYHENMSKWCNLQEIVNANEYQAVLNSQTSIVEKKISLMKFFKHSFARPEGLLANYYDKTSLRDESLHAAIAAEIRDLEETINPMRIVRGIALISLDICKPISINNHLYLIDLYRRLGDFDNAQKYIALEKAQKYYADAYDMQKYIQLQESLIQDRNTQLM